ncbi:MAG: transposase [Planctomycetota bacterium]
MSRGDRKEVVFRSDADRELWLTTLGQACERTGWKIHAYVIMPNHFHLLLETPEANLVAGMKWFQGTFTQRINTRRELPGHLFQGRYKALVIDPTEKRHFETVAHYIHMNPLRAGILRKSGMGLKDFPWSSFPYYLTHPRMRPQWLDVSSLFWALGLRDNARDRKRLEKRMHEIGLGWSSAKGKKDLEKEWKPIRRGWYLGEERFKSTLLDLIKDVVKGKKRDSFSGDATTLHDEQKAIQLLGAGLRALNMNEEALLALKKGAPEKAAMAWLLHARTTVGNRWISERLQTGHPGRIPVLVRQAREGETAELAKLKGKLAKC